jgi:hypothetical protein
MTTKCLFFLIDNVKPEEEALKDGKKKDVHKYVIQLDTFLLICCDDFSIFKWAIAFVFIAGTGGKRSIQLREDGDQCFVRALTQCIILLFYCFI